MVHAQRGKGSQHASHDRAACHAHARLQVKRTVRGYAAAGFAGILIEDQQVGGLAQLLLGGPLGAPGWLLVLAAWHAWPGAPPARTHADPARYRAGMPCPCRRAAVAQVVRPRAQQAGGGAGRGRGAHPRRLRRPVGCSCGGRDWGLCCCGSTGCCRCWLLVPRSSCTLPLIHMCGRFSQPTSGTRAATS